MAPRLTFLLLSSAAALVSLAAAPDDEMNAMTAAFDAALNGMAYLGRGCASSASSGLGSC